MILIAALAVVISAREGGFALALPILGALALGAQRLLLCCSRSISAGRSPPESVAADPGPRTPALAGRRAARRSGRVRAPSIP